MTQAATSSSTPRLQTLLRSLLLLMGGQLAMLCIACKLSTGHWNAIRLMWAGCDSQFYYYGATYWLSGRNPYDFIGFVTPPPSLALPALMIKAHLDVQWAAFLFSALTAILVPLSVWRYARVLGLAVRDCFLLVCVSLLFTSTLDLIHNGNMDGLIFACLVAAFTLRSASGGALAMAAGIGLKLYPAALLAVLARHRQWRRILLTAGWLLLLMLPFVHLWSASWHALAYRQSRHDIRSVAPAAILNLLTGHDGHALRVVCFVFWLGTLLLALYNDHKRTLTPWALARYAPWLMAWPALVFPYAGVNLLPVPIALAARAARRRLLRLEYLSLLGFLLFNLRLEQLTNLLPIPDYKKYWHIAPAIQACGVVLMMLGSCLSVSRESSEDTDEAIC